LSDPQVKAAPEGPSSNGPGTVHRVEPPAPIAEPHRHTSIWARIKQHKIAEWTLA
jgi:hypothetical protein